MDIFKLWDSNSLYVDFSLSSFVGAWIFLYVFANVLSFNAIINPAKNRLLSVSLMLFFWKSLFNCLIVFFNESVEIIKCPYFSLRYIFIMSFIGSNFPSVGIFWYALPFNKKKSPA